MNSNRNAGKHREGEEAAPTTETFVSSQPNGTKFCVVNATEHNSQYYFFFVTRAHEKIPRERGYTFTNGKVEWNDRRIVVCSYAYLNIEPRTFTQLWAREHHHFYKYIPIGNLEVRNNNNNLVRSFYSIISFHYVTFEIGYSNAFIIWRFDRNIIFYYYSKCSWPKHIWHEVRNDANKKQ